LETEKPQTGLENVVATDADSPRIAFSESARAAAVRPPLKPYGAKRANPFFGGPVSGRALSEKSSSKPVKEPAAKPRAATPTLKHTRGNAMSDRMSSDRLAAFTPQIPKRVADIPNLSSLRGSEADTDGKRLIVGKQIRMSGEIAGCEKLIVEGKVDAKLSEVKSLEVTANGAFNGDAQVENAVIAGTYEGTLRVSGHLEIGPAGTVKGSVSYKTIMVANGGKLQGSIETIAD